MALLRRIKELLNTLEFEENAVLQQLAMLCDFVLGQSLQSTPLSKLITGMQFIAEKCEEWDSTVPRAFSIGLECTGNIVNLLLDWRRLEKSGWQVMLEGRHRDVE